MRDMATLLHLPHELLYRVFDFLLPEDLEKFAQSCKAVRSLAGPFLEQHRALVREYNTITNHGSPRAVGDILIKILRNPRLGRYVKELDLERLGTGILPKDGQTHYSSEVIALIRKAVRPRILSRNALACGPTLLAILMAHTPNLASISLWSGDLRHTKFSEFLSGDLVRTGAFLPKLRTVVVRPEEAVYMSRGCDLLCIQMLSAIPSVRTVSAPRAEDLVTPIQVTHTQFSNVTHLNLLETRISARTFVDFLRGFTNLESLRYSCLYRGMSMTDPFLIRSGLAIAAKSTLRFLTLLMPSSIKSGLMGSLRAFEKLEYLETEWDFLVQPSHYSLLETEMPVSIKGTILHDRKSRKPPKYQEVVDAVASVESIETAPLLEHLVFKGSYRVSAKKRSDMIQKCLPRRLLIDFLVCSPDDLIGEDLPHRYGKSLG